MCVLSLACCAAPTELARLPGTVGLQVTHYWLASLLASLATRVWPFNAVVYTGPKVRFGQTSMQQWTPTVPAFTCVSKECHGS